MSNSKNFGFAVQNIQGNCSVLKYADQQIRIVPKHEDLFWVLDDLFAVTKANGEQRWDAIKAVRFEDVVRVVLCNVPVSSDVSATTEQKNANAVQSTAYLPDVGIISIADNSVALSTEAVNEVGLYTCLSAIDTPEARNLKKWIMYDVLPSYRVMEGWFQPKATEDSSVVDEHEQITIWKMLYEAMVKDSKRAAIGFRLAKLTRSEIESYTQKSWELINLLSVEQFAKVYNVPMEIAQECYEIKNSPQNQEFNVFDFY